MDEKDLRSIIEQVLTEMNVSGAKPAEKAAAACACESAPEVEDGCIPDITEIDIRKQYLVKNPENGEEYAELKMNAPCRLGIGKAGARYNTLPTPPPRTPCLTTWTPSSWRRWACGRCRPSATARTPI